MVIVGCTSVSRWKILRFMKMLHLYKSKRKPGPYWKMLETFTKLMTSLPSKGRSCTFCLSLSWRRVGESQLLVVRWSILAPGICCSSPPFTQSLPCGTCSQDPLEQSCCSLDCSKSGCFLSVWWGAENGSTVLIEVRRSWITLYLAYLKWP